MNITDILKMLSQYGLAGIFAGIIGWIIYKVGLRMIDALDRVVAKLDALGQRIDDKIDEHTRADAELREEVVRLGARIDTALELTPVTPVRRQTPHEGSPIAGYYPPSRPKTHGGR